MSLPIVSADKRLKEIRHIKRCIFDKIIKGHQGGSLRPRIWQECRDIAAFVGALNRSLHCWRTKKSIYTAFLGTSKRSICFDNHAIQ